MARATTHPLRWILLFVILVVALSIGAGVFSSTPQTNAQRAAALDARLKAPDSNGLSVAESNSAAAAAVRQQVRTEVNQGRNDSEIVASLEARYGNAVLLTPPAGGLTVLLWAVPLGLLILIALAVVITARKRRLPAVASPQFPSAPDPASDPNGEDAHV